MTINLEINSLRAFVAVAELGSFTQAAKQLFITQSTISQKIKMLEEQTGTLLFRRTTRSTSLTSEGELLLKEALAIIALVDSAEARISGSQLSGEIRLGIPEEFASGGMPDLLARFRLRQPNIKLLVTVGIGSDLENAVKHGDLDLAIIKTVPARRDGVGHQQMVWAGSDVPKKGNTVPLALFPEPCVFRHTAVKALKKVGIEYEIVLTTTSHQSLHAAARSGFAMTVLASSDCPRELLATSPGSTLPKLPQMAYRFFRHEENNEPVQVLEQIIRDQFGRISTAGS